MPDPVPLLAETTQEITLPVATVVSWALAIIAAEATVIALLWRKSERLERIVYKLTTAVREDDDEEGSK